MKTIDQTIKEICAQTSLEEHEVKANIEDWALALMMKGIVVGLEIKRWRAKVTMKEEDLFLTQENDEDWQEFQSNYLSFGRRLVIPKRIDDRLNSIERMARRNLEQYSFNTVWGSFVPCTVFDDWRIRNEQLKAEFYRARREICEEWEPIKKEILDEYTEFSKILYKKHNPDVDYEEFENKILSQVKNSIMTSETFYRSFQFDSIFYYIPVPTQVQTEMFMAEKILDKRDQMQKEVEMRNFVHEETMKKKSEQIESFLNETVFRIREMMMSIIDEVKTAVALDRSSVATGKTRSKLLKMIDKVRKVDFFSDEEVQNALDKLQIDLEKENEYRSEDEIMRSLEELEAITKANITNVGSGRARLLEL